MIDRFLIHNSTNFQHQLDVLTIRTSVLISEKISFSKFTSYFSACMISSNWLLSNRQIQHLFWSQPISLIYYLPRKILITLKKKLFLLLLRLVYGCAERKKRSITNNVHSSGMEGELENWKWFSEGKTVTLFRFKNELFLFISLLSLKQILQS